METVTKGKVLDKKIIIPLGLISLFLLFQAAAFAQPPHMMGQGMMDDESREKLMEQRGYGYGYGPMMGGYGSMMGGGYGSMMGGGYGPMMGGMMMGLYGLDLSKVQREKIRDIQFRMRKHNLELMAKMMDSSDKLAELYDSDKLDAGKIGKVYDEVFKIKREMIQQYIRARNEIYEELNKEQRKQFRSYGSYGHMGMGMMY
jgi:Spy/CpxP family protein refolding chaperone